MSYEETISDSVADGPAPWFFAVVIGVPIVIFILLICLCCWCCHCCCCAKNTQQVVVLPPSGPTSTIVNTTMMTPYSPAYAPLPADPGYVNHLFTAQQNHQLPMATGQYARQRAIDDQMLLMDRPPPGRQSQFVDPLPGGHPEFESCPEDPSRNQIKPPPYSAQQ